MPPAAQHKRAPRRAPAGQGGVGVHVVIKNNIDKEEQCAFAKQQRGIFLVFLFLFYSLLKHNVPSFLGINYFFVV